MRITEATLDKVCIVLYGFTVLYCVHCMPWKSVLINVCRWYVTAVTLDTMVFHCFWTYCYKQSRSNINRTCIKILSLSADIEISILSSWSLCLQDTVICNKQNLMPKLRKNRRIETRWGVKYYTAVRDAVFVTQAPPYVPAEPPPFLREHASVCDTLYVCSQCKDW